MIWTWRGREWDLHVNWTQLCFGGWADRGAWMLFLGPICLMVDPPEGEDEAVNVIRENVTTCPLCGNLIRRAPTKEPP